MTFPTSQGFVPASFDASDFAHIHPLLQQLQQRNPASAQDVQQWLADFSALDEAIDEHGSRKYINYTCHTDDDACEKAYLHFIEQVAPKLQAPFFELQKKYIALAAQYELPGPMLKMLHRQWQAEVEIYRQANVPLQTQTAKLASEYGKVLGAMLIDWDGEQRTMQQMNRFLEEPDRVVRERAWRAIQERRLRDRSAIDEIFQKQLTLREQIAINAQMDNYRAYAWKSRKRFDYTPDDCLAFGDTVAESCMPLVQKLDRERAQQLGLSRLRPWDLAVDPYNRAPLRPFDPKQIDTLVTGAGKILHAVRPMLGEHFARMKMGRNLDLESRKGKQPGGYQSSLDVIKEPFIFMNAAGSQDDVHTLLHEAGHAFHYMQSCAVPLSFVRHAPLEFCEVASMSMELLSADHFGLFYDNPDDGARAKRGLLEGVIRLMPWIATIDGFQHWLYTHPGHSGEERTAAWLALLDRFGSDVVDWSGFEQERAAMWQKQGHLFRAPFYYIEYGIAQLGALQVWMKYHDQPQQVLEDLWKAFELGGTRPLPELFETAGARFDFSSQTIAPLMQKLDQELAELPV